MTSTQILMSAVLGSLILFAKPGEARIVKKQQSEVPENSQTRFPKNKLDRLATISAADSAFTPKT